MTTRNFLKPLLSLCFIFTLLAFGMTADAQQQAKRPYTEVIFSDKTSDLKAVEIVQKLMKDDFTSMEKIYGSKPKIFASFESLGPDLPKTAIFAFIDHKSVCGSSGCETFIFIPGDNNKYNIAFDLTLGRIFKNLRPNNKYYDILTIVAPRPTDGFGVYYWNEQKKIYTYAGGSKFKKN